MANLAPVFKQQFFDSNGDPLVGGKLYSYAAGTTTPKGTFKDRDAAVANTNPIILDARGECDVWIYGSYKFVLKDSNDVTQWTVDKVSGEAQVIMSVADITARDAIPAALRYEGMLVYVASEKKTYQLQGGITNSNWSAFFGSTPVINTFTGNAVLTAFTLSVDPGFKENVMAFIDGVRQELSQYSVSGSTLTFTFAPYDGASIQTIVQTVNVVNVPANGSVTKSKLAALGQQISLSVASFSTTSASYVDVTDLNVPITTTGRPVFVGLVSTAGISSFSTFSVGAVTFTAARIKILRDLTSLCEPQIAAGGPSGIYTKSVPPSSVFTIDTPIAGTYVYKIQMLTSSTTNAQLTNVKLIAYEL